MFIETGVRQGAPKYMEWYGGFGLLMTHVSPNLVSGLIEALSGVALRALRSA